MTHDDDSILSAYLDGQLGPDEQQVVESALFADSQLAEELRSLTLLRDVVAGLARESSPDLTSAVMRRVRRRALLGSVTGAVPWGPVRAAVLVAVAAGLLAMAVPLLLHPGRGPAAGPAAAPLAQSGPAEKDHPVREGTTQPLGTAERRPSPAGRIGGEQAVSGNLVHVREYLDNPQLRRIFLVSDLEDGSALRQVASIVEQTTRLDFYKITISQGIVIDPRHPDQATVFALVVGPRELDSLRHRLSEALKDRVEESTAEPAIVTQLADIGQVEACQPSPVADMAIPRDAALAFQDRNAAAGGEAAEAPPAEHPKPDDRPTLEQERSAPVGELLVEAQASGTKTKPDRPAVAGARNQPANGPAPARQTDQSYVVLVWVSRARPG